jgi:hypothetical protein
MTRLTAVKVTFGGTCSDVAVIKTTMRSDPGIFRRRIYGWLVQSSPRPPLRELFLALCCFFVLIRRSLSDFCLLPVSWVPRYFHGVTGPTNP